jgi:hypothetical protein
MIAPKWLVSLSIALAAAGVTAHAQGKVPAVLRDAQKLAGCMKALDAPCVVALSDVAAYERLSPPGFQFAAAQTRFFDALRENGSRYARFEITGTPVTFAKGGARYAFVPYRSASVLKEQRHESTSYFIGRSADGGVSWHFVDGGSLDADQIRIVIPSYDGQPPLPSVTR